MKKDTQFCVEDSLIEFNKKIAFAADFYPIQELNYLCYESKFPGIGIYNRSLLIVSSKTVRDLTNDEFLAVTGHELAHTYFADEMTNAVINNDYENQKLIELKCDVIGLSLLIKTKIKKSAFLSGLNKFKKIPGEIKIDRIDGYIAYKDRVSFINKASSVLLARQLLQAEKNR